MPENHIRDEDAPLFFALSTTNADADLLSRVARRLATCDCGHPVHLHSRDLGCLVSIEHGPRNSARHGWVERCVCRANHHNLPASSTPGDGDFVGIKGCGYCGHGVGHTTDECSTPPAGGEVR